ncbi:MAG: signal peptidase II [Nitrospira sp.]|nr:signal peptidase II [Nitrospira sp.]
MNDSPLPNFLLASLTGVVIAVDQVTKLRVMQTMRLHESIQVIPNFFSLTYIRNPGAAFGLLAGSSQTFRLIFFGVTSLFALGLLSAILLRMPEQDTWGRFSVAGILGGAIGNMIDRIRYGEVIDFLDFYINDYHWPAFNVADSAITVGVICLIIHFAFEKKEGRPPSGERPPVL